MGNWQLLPLLLSRRPRAAAVALVALAGAAAACGGSSVAAHHSGATKQAAPRHASTPTTSVIAPTPTTSAPTTTAPPTTQPAPAAASLVQKAPPGNHYQVKVPQVWTFKNATVPSDHVTNVWVSPADPSQHLTVVASACQGCVKRTLKSQTPDPSLVVPSGATSTTPLNPYTLDYQAPAATAGSVDYGRILVMHRGTVITGYVRLDVVLPAGSQQVATQMLDSFSLPS